MNSFWWFAKIVGLFGLFVLAMIVVTLFKKGSREISDQMINRPGQSLLWGLVLLIVTPIISFILFFTIIGAPLAVILLIIYGVTIYLSTIFVGLVIGRKILGYLQNRKAVDVKTKKEPSLLWSVILGILVFSLVVDMFLGFSWEGVGLAMTLLTGLIKFLALIWALGAIFVTRRQNLTNPSK